MLFDESKKEAAVVLLYDFDQLDEKLQQKIIQDSRASFAESVDYDYDISTFLVDAEEKGLSVKSEDIRFSLCGVQGDGASFVTEHIDFRKVIEDNGFVDKFPILREKNNLDEFIDGLKGVIHRVDDMYSHKNTVSSDVWYSGDFNDFYGFENIAYALKICLDEIKDELCDSLYANLQATHDNELSDKNIFNYYQSGGDKFFVDGTRANPEIFDYSDNAKRAIAFMKLPSMVQEDIGAMIDKESALALRCFGR